MYCMNENRLAVFTIVFISVIFIAFFATEINKPTMSPTGMAGTVTATSGDGPCWKAGTGKKVYDWYLKLAAASIKGENFEDVLDKILSDTKYDNLDDLLQDVNSPDKETSSFAQGILDKILNSVKGVNKFNFDFGKCKITCDNEKTNSVTCIDKKGQRKDVMYIWIGDGSIETRQSLIDPNRPNIIEFEKVDKSNVVAREPNLAMIVANRDMMEATCYCAEIELGCCEEKGGLSFKNQGPLQAQWKRNPILDTYQSDVCPAPNKWIPGVCPTSDPQRRPVGKC